MRSKYIAVMLACLLLLGIASAQEYSIRANRGLNLRAAPSLNADIADTVRSGTILQVVGSFNRWLKIDRNGSEVWLADWVDYSRVDSGEPSGSPQPTAPAGQPIDNCCFVDRQCRSDEEWGAGYWAYQNGQCAAPAQPEPATPAQPVASAPANVDNCCFVNRQCHSDEEWVAGYWAFQNNQCPAPAQPSAIPPSRPLIEGSSRFVRHVSAVLDLLERRAPEWYAYVIGGIDKIVELPEGHVDLLPYSWADCTGLAYATERKVGLGTCHIDVLQGFGASYIDDLHNTAGALAHEACHIHRYEAGFVYDSTTRKYEELECGKPTVGVEAALDPYGALTYLGEPALRVVRRFCAEGFSPELYCPAIQRLQGG